VKYRHGFAARFERVENGRRRAAVRIAVAYALLASIAIALSMSLRDGPPWVYPKPLLNLAPGVALTLSTSLGVAFASAIIIGTRLVVVRFEWARRLHAELRPIAVELTLGEVLIVAGLSSLGEELLFRGLLTPTTGVVISAVIFGLAHQVRGKSRWVWATWATLVGLVFGLIFAATGSLVGPLVAHALINAVNLSYLRDHEPGHTGVR
jgi:membrane protease YdiL (CAAX protease family)